MAVLFFNIGNTIMANPLSSKQSSAVDRLAELLASDGWSVAKCHDVGRPNLVAQKDELRYGIEVKSVAEPRPDRVLASLSQAILQAHHHSKHMGLEALAVVSVNSLSEPLLDGFRQFHGRYAPDVAVGLFSPDGGAFFAGPGLAHLSKAPAIFDRRQKGESPRKAYDLFSDLNQWLLKVLLAPELPENLLQAPRAAYSSGADLAEAAKVSAMSVSRFLRRCDEEGFVDSSSGKIRLVRRRELFRRWQSAQRSSPEINMQFALPSASSRQLSSAAIVLEACVGSFAAADVLKIGHVSGAVPCLYVPRLSQQPARRWDGLERSRPGEKVHLILKQSPNPQSLFRGAVEVRGMMVSDVIQIWLDCSSHPSRGAEQAEFLSSTVLRDMMRDRH